jgi:hypothetical protein
MEVAVKRYRLLLACLPCLALFCLALTLAPGSSAPSGDSSAETRLFDRLRSHGTISHSDLPFTISAREVRGRRLVNVVLKTKNARGEIDLVACAREAELTVNTSKGQLLVRLLHGNALAADGTRSHFAERTWEASLPEELGR